MSIRSFRLALFGAAALMLVGAGGASANPYNVSEIPRMIVAGEARKLHAAGVHVTDELFRRGATADQRQQLAKQTGLRGARIDQLVRYAALLQLQNIGPEWVMLLDAAGVKSVTDLGTRTPPALARKVAAVNRARHIINPTPTEAQIGDWIAQAEKLSSTAKPAAATPGATPG